MAKIVYALPDKAIEIIEELAQEEFYAISFYTYLSFCCTSKGYFRAADHFMGESQNERQHYLRLSDFLQARGVEPEVPEVKEPKIEFTDLRSGIEAAYRLEISLTEKYDEAIMMMRKIDTMAYLKLCEFMHIQEGALAEMNNLWSVFDTAVSEMAQREAEESYWARPEQVIA